MDDRLLTREELQDRWNISSSQFDRMKAAGDLPSYVAVSERVHRWRESVVAQWEAEREGTGGAS